MIAPKVAGEPTAPTWTMAYNADGTVLTSTDPNEHVTRYHSYDPSGQPTKVEDATGAVTRVGYDVDGLVRWVQDPNHELATRDPATDAGRADYTTVFEYDDLHQLVRTSTPKSTKYERGTLLWSRQAYDRAGNVVRTGEPRFGGQDPGWGRSSQYSHDAMGRLTTDTDPAGKVWTSQYDAAGRITRSMSPRGLASPTTDDDFAAIFEYDAVDRIERTTRHEVNSGLVTSTIRAHQCYEVDGDVARIVQPRANVVTVDCANPASAAQWSTVFEYDAAHRQTKATDAEGRATETGYDAHGNVVSQTDGGGVVQTTDYDERDQRVKHTAPFDAGRNLVTQWRYDQVGNLVKLISPRASDAAPAGSEPTQFTTEYSYDGADRLVRTKLPTSATEPEAAYSHIVRDRNGQEVVTALPSTAALVADVPAGAKTLLTRFDPGWVRSSDDPSFPAISAVFFDYTSRGQQAERVPGIAGQPGVLDVDETMLWRYTPNGLLSSVHDRTGQLSRFTYNDDGLMTTATDSSGIGDTSEKAREVYTTYDGYNRLTRTDYRRRGETAVKVTEYGYDLDGNIVSRDDDGSATALYGAAAGAYRNRFAYDRTGRERTAMELGNATTCTGDRRTLRDYTAQGWEKERVVQASTATSCADDKLNTSFSNRQATTWTHFLNGKLKTLSTVDRGGAVVESHDVGYLDGTVYVDGQRTTDTFTLKGPGATTCATAACTATYKYDAKGRLVRHDDGHGGISTYAFDAPASQSVPTLRAGNLTSEDDAGTARSYTYDGVRMITSASGAAASRYWYDAAGNVDCVTASTGAVGDCSPMDGQTVSPTLQTDYGYDGLDRMVASRTYTATTLSRSASYVYDALDRVVKEDDKAGTNSRSTTFTYQGLTQLVATEGIAVNGVANADSKRYGYDAQGLRISMSRSVNGAAALGYTYAYDVHGSTSLLMDESAPAGPTTVKASYGYKPYGAADTALTKGDTDGFTQINPYRFSAKRFDVGSQTHDMGSRRLAGAGRFIQGDRYYGAMEDLSLSTDPLTQNRYALAGGNPVGYQEWDGHVPIDGGDGTAAAEPVTEPVKPPVSDDNRTGQCEIFDCSSSTAPVAAPPAAVSDDNRNRLCDIVDCAAAPRQAGATGMSAQGIEWMIQPGVEGFKPIYDRDSNYTRNCTIGYGHLLHTGACTDAEWDKYRNLTRAEARVILEKDLRERAQLILKHVKRPLEPHQLDALLSYAYNRGIGSYYNSNLTELINAGNFDAVPDELLRGGSRDPAIVRRRQMEGDIFSRAYYTDLGSMVYVGSAAGGG